MLQLSSAGNNFPVGHAAIVRYMDVEAGPPYTAHTMQELTVTFSDLGLPPSTGTSPVPYIFFVDPVDQVRHMACQNLEATVLTNPLSINSGASTAGLECSFAGGCNYSVAASGLSAALKANPNNYIEICENKCVFQESLSTDSQATCTVPSLATTYSAAYYYQETSKILTGAWTGSEMSEISKVNDGDLDVSINDPNSSCFI